ASELRDAGAPRAAPCPAARRRGATRAARGPQPGEGRSGTQHLAPQLVEPVGGDGVPDARHQPGHEAQVVDRGELLAELLVGLEEVAQVGARVVGARVAVAALLDRPEVPGEARVEDVDAVAGVHASLRAPVLL